MNLLDLESTDSDHQPPAGITWSQYSLDIFQALEDPGQNLQIDGVAGCGKTTNLIEAVRRVEDSCFLAFNKSIADELRSRVTSGQVFTLNGLGHKIVAENMSRSKFNMNKLFDLSQNIPGELKKYGGEIRGVVGLAKNNGLGTPQNPYYERSDFYQLLLATDLPAAHLDLASHIAYKLFEDSITDASQWDFDDQLFYPVFYQYPFPGFMNVLCDEDQDLSPINQMMLGRLADRGARIIGVGDEHQAIYGFRGAMQDSIHRLVHRFKMKRMPLSICYRCDKSIIELAKELCPHIEARPGAAEGSVIEADELPGRFAQDQMILCRTNAPLFTEILRYVARGEPCRPRTDIIKKLSAWVKSTKVNSSKELLSHLERWYTKEYSAAREIGAKSRMRSLTDRDWCLKQVCTDRTASEVLNLLSSLESSNQGPIFSTVHKAKGLEAPSVFILRPDLLPAPWVNPEDQPGEYQQELNLKYVAITRAKHELILGPEDLS